MHFTQKEMPLINQERLAIVFQFFNLFGRVGQLSFGNSSREPNDHDFLRSISL